MPRLKLSYFDAHGGRGETARVAMSIGDIEFEDDRIPRKDWPHRKAETPLGSVPVLEVDGVAVTQSNAINRFVGRLADLYPGDPVEALRCDEVMDTVEDLAARIAVTFSMPDGDGKRAARQALADGPITTYLRRFERQLAERGDWFAGGRLSVADLKIVFDLVRHLRSGKLDHVASDLTDRVAPRLVAHMERVLSHPGVVAYYQKRGLTP